MHETALALSVLDTVCQQCRRQGFQRILSVRLRIGAAAGVHAEALAFAFDVAKAGTPAAEARLEIDTVPLGGECRGCGRPFTSDQRLVLACPHCQGGDIAVTQGFETDILDMDVE